MMEIVRITMLGNSSNCKQEIVRINQNMICINRKQFDCETNGRTISYFCNSKYFPKGDSNYFCISKLPHVPTSMPLVALLIIFTQNKVPPRVLAGCNFFRLVSRENIEFFLMSYIHLDYLYPILQCVYDSPRVEKM